MSASETVVLTVEGMSCHSCVRHIEAALDHAFDPLERRVDLAAGTVSVTYAPGEATAEAIAALLTAEGYPAR